MSILQDTGKLCKPSVFQGLTNMIVDHQGNIRCSRFEITVPDTVARRARQVGPSISLGHVDAVANEIGLEISDWGWVYTENQDLQLATTDWVFRSDWRLPTRGV